MYCNHCGQGLVEEQVVCRCGMPVQIPAPAIRNPPVKGPMPYMWGYAHGVFMTLQGVKPLSGLLRGTQLGPFRLMWSVVAILLGASILTRKKYTVPLMVLMMMISASYWASRIREIPYYPFVIVAVAVTWGAFLYYYARRWREFTF
jgi:hypothetical protein